MKAYREIIASSRLDNVVNLPPQLKNREVEIIILPVGKKIKKRKRLSQEWAGALIGYRNQYTSLELQKKPLEWREA
jgi:hypothetical protein